MLGSVAQMPVYKGDEFKYAYLFQTNNRLFIDSAFFGNLSMMQASLKDTKEGEDEILINETWEYTVADAEIWWTALQD